MSVVTRRSFLAGLSVALGGLAAPGRPVRSQQQPQSGQGEVGTLRDPAAAGPPKAPATARDNEPFLQSVEHRIRCTCGCNLDVYTCRTTDFTCSTSPRMHREVLALQDQGKNADQIVAAFVAQYGEQVLMAPKPEGFNLAGYLVPGALLLMGGGLLTVLLRRRMRVAAAERVTVPSESMPDATPEEMARLNRELADLERE
ncbi:MAG TPA: cytochrome c-type biogenesis protein CcmH [Gemmatimonadales bacterium]|nr:cytochrome c-type biogenesis protein CcmH [Gemmatimonadales bacterium]